MTSPLLQTPPGPVLGVAADQAEEAVLELVTNIVPHYYPEIIAGIQKVRESNGLNPLVMSGIKMFLVDMIECSPRRALNLFHTATETSSIRVSAEVQDQIISLLKIISSGNPMDDEYECDELPKKYASYWSYFDNNPLPKTLFF